jgi:hypothetical protein
VVGLTLEGTVDTSELDSEAVRDFFVKSSKSCGEESTETVEQMCDEFKDADLAEVAPLWANSYCPEALNR